MRISMVELSPSGGLYQFTFQLGLHLARAGDEVELLTGPDPEIRSNERGFTVSPILPTWHSGAATVEARWLRKTRRVWRGVRHVMALVRVLSHLRRHQVDAVFWHELRFPMDSWCVVLATKLSRNTLNSVVLHETRPLNENARGGSLYKESPMIHRSLAAAVARMDAIFVLGDHARDYVRSTWEPACPVQVIAHGDENVFVNEASTTSVELTPPRVLFFGIWTRHKGIELLIDAFARVREDLPDAELVIAGSVTANVDFDDIERRARVVPGVLLRPGYVPMEEVPKLMGSARVVAVPYLRANQSGVVHLAQTFGRPVIASDVGDIPSAVPHEEAGIIVPAGDVDALALALIRLLGDPELAAKMGAAGQQRLAAHGAWSDIATAVATVLNTERNHR